MDNGGVNKQVAVKMQDGESQKSDLILPGYRLVRQLLKEVL